MSLKLIDKFWREKNQFVIIMLIMGQIRISITSTFLLCYYSFYNISLNGEMVERQTIKFQIVEGFLIK